VDNNKKISINFVGFGDSFNPQRNRWWNILVKYYDVVIDKINPQYIFCGPTTSKEEGPFPFCKYDGIRIMLPGENNDPDFNVYDYAIQYCDILFSDRFFRFPPVLNHFLPNDINTVPNKLEKFSIDVLLKKNIFCDFIYRHDRDDGMREKIFRALSSYKKVVSCGTFLNNMDNDQTVSLTTKMDIQKKSKFSIAIDSVSQPGFVTEKILDAFIANSIPIYFGDPEIEKVFNEKAFINCNKCKDINEVLEIVKEIDNNDQMYFNMLNEPIWANGFNPDDYLKGQEEFICHIIDQKYTDAFRRPIGPDDFGGVIKSQSDLYKEFNYMYNDFFYRCIRKIQKIFNR